MAGKTEIRPYRRIDAGRLLKGIRDIDRLEVEAMEGTPLNERYIHNLASRSRGTMSGYRDGRLVAIYGVTAKVLLGREGCPWLLATKEAERPRVQRWFARNSRKRFAELQPGFSFLWNAVSEENEISIRWLEWLGFTMHRHIPHEVRGVTFVPFSMEL